jgi:ubiquitin carboxyl-terminal hydrolase 14
VKVKWGQEAFDKVEVDTDEEPMLFKAQLFALTGVQPHKQKVMLKGALLKDDAGGWTPLKPKLKNGVTLLMMGTKDEDSLVVLKDSEKTQVNNHYISLTIKRSKVF